MTEPKRYDRWVLFFSEGVESLLRFVWPGRCAGCDALRALSQTLFCESCAQAAYPCGEFTPPEGIDQAFACFEYTQPVRHALHAWKYDGREPIGVLLATHMAEAMLPTPQTTKEERAEGEAVWVVPVPLHPKRLRERGFDQTLELARALAKRAHARLGDSALRRARFEGPQVGLDALARAANVEGAFVCAQPLPRGAEVWLIDDVCTTGSTAKTCAKTLREAGAGRIVLLTFAHARSLRDDDADGDDQGPGR